MRRGTGSAAQAWAALVATTYAVLAVVAPCLLLSAAAESAPLTIALMTVALAALVCVELRSVALAGAGAGGTTRPTGVGAPLVLTGRATDPVHHPLRPRAPGTA